MLLLQLQVVLSTLFVLPYSQAQSYGTVRLWRDNTTSPQYTSGRVQLYTTLWGNVCGDVVFSAFSLEMAGVVCRQLGYLGASSTSIASTDTYEFDPSPTLIDNVNCGSEPRNFLVLMRCSFSTFISSSCDDEDDVGVACYTNRLWDDPFPWMVRLQDGPFSSEGLVEVYCNGVWNKVCGGSSFSVNDADTVCLQLGYKGSGDITEVSSSSFKLFDTFSCSQARPCINSCQLYPFTQTPFACTSDAYLQCHYELPFSKDGSERYSCTSDYYPRGEGAIRLARGALYSLEYTSGRVQVYYDGVWGNVCRLGGFDLTAADVMCRQLGWIEALSWSYSTIDDFGEDVRIAVFDSILCSSSEFLVMQQCSYATDVSPACSDADDVSITCSDVPIWNLPFTGMVRLVGSDFINEGRVEVYCNGEWGTVCSNSADASDRRAICRQLGYNQGFSDSAVTPGSAESTIPIWLDDLFCFSGVSYNCITECQMCPGVPSTDIDCQTHDNDLTVQCYISESVSTLSQTLKDCQITVQVCPEGVSVEGSLILHRDGIDSSSHTAGIAVLYHDGQWGNICALSPISSREADVICHQMTYTGASSWTIRPDHSFGTDSRDSVIENMNCSRGSELTVLQCSFTDDINCHDSADVAVTCYSSRIWDNPFAGMVRLMEGDFTNEGRLEVYCSGQWGTVCDDTFDSNDGGAVCRQLGYDFSQDVDYITLRGDLFSPIWLNDLHCSSDTSLSCINHCQMCPDNAVSICTHSDDVTVRCSHSTSNRRQYNNGYDRSCAVEPFVPDNPVDGSIILGRGNSYSLQHTSGHVLVRDDLSWGTICRNGVFGNTEADVICHQLTYSGASSWSYAAVDEFGSDSVPFLMTDLQCSDPNLLVIFQCSFNRASADCGRGDEVSVSCYTSRIWDNPFDGMIRLTNSSYTNEGLLEVYCNGEWGTVCDDMFGLSGARAACLQLGYHDYSNFNHLTELQGLPSQEIWLDDVDCSSDVQCLTGCQQCPSSPDHNCIHFEDVTLQCRAVTSVINTNLLTTCSYSSGPNLGTIIGSTSGAIAVLILLTVLFAAWVRHKRRSRNHGNCPNPFSTLAQQHTSTATIPVTTSTTTTAETNFYSNVQSSDIPLETIPATEHQTPPTFDRSLPPPPYNPNHDSANVHLSHPPPEQEEKDASRENPTEFTIKAPPPYDPSWGVGKPV